MNSSELIYEAVFNKRLFSRIFEGRLTQKESVKYAGICHFIEDVRQRYLRSSFVGRQYQWKGYPVVTFLYPPLNSQIEKHFLINRLLKMFKLKNPVFSCTVALTYECSMSCSHCYATQYHNQEATYLNVEQYRHLFKELKEKGIWHIDLTGGEPLQRKDVFGVINQIDSNYSTGILATNGLHLTKKNVRQIRESNIMVCKVSLDISSQENRLSDITEKCNEVLDGIQQLQKERILTFVQIFIERGISANKTLFEKMLTICEEINIPLIHIITPLLVGRIKGCRDLLLDKKDRGYLKKIIKQKHARLTMSVFPDWEFFRGTNDMACCAVQGRSYITAYGDVYPCNFLPEHSYGNILKERFDVIYERMNNQFKALNSCPASQRRPCDYRVNADLVEN